MTTEQWIEFGGIFALGVAAIWWLLFRPRPRLPSPPTVPLGPEDIRRIEDALAIELPESYTSFLQSPRSGDIDGTSIMANHEQIIALTREYRAGYGGAPKWPKKFVYIGDESDACPYALDCESEVVVQTDHGNLEEVPLARYATFGAFVRSFCAK